MISTRTAVIGAAVIILSLASLTTSLATAAPPGFSPSAVSESFEDLNRPDVPSAILNLPTPFTFPSGLSIVSPVPNAVDTSGVFIVEGGFFGFTPGPNDEGIPDGEAYLGQGNPGLTDPVRLAFPQTVARVGAYVAINGVDVDSVTVAALDAANIVLDSTVVSNIGPPDWSQNFVTLSSPGIASLQFTGTGSGVLRVDLVTWDVVPEPASAGLAGFVAVVIALAQRPSRLRCGQL
jgi:hypothetical protein